MISLLKENDPKLHEISTPWDFDVDGSPEELVKEMAFLLQDQGGIGLAAPQVGINKRILIMGNFIKLVACINPKIVSVSDERAMDLEGCLSFPELWMKVKRPASCVVQYQTVTGELVERELTGLESRVFLHEFDHLMGVTFDMRVGEVTLSMSLNKRAKQLKRAARASA
jgi:peptide deformylase